MASPKKQERRRLRRQARVKRVTFRKIRIDCPLEGVDAGKVQRHWIRIYSDGSVTFLDHPGVTVQELGVQGALMSHPCGCAYLAFRITHNQIHPSQAATGGRNKFLDERAFGEGPGQLIQDIGYLRNGRGALREALLDTRMLPIRQSLIYRKSLVLERIKYRVERLVATIQKRVYPYNTDQEPHEPDFHGGPFHTGKVHSGAHDERNFTWDY